MNLNKITDSVYNVSVLNPNLRVFDIVMRTDYGTSYNSYIVKGSEKTALIESSHLTFADYYIDNIEQVTELSKIEYLIMNHNEPDHSGAISSIIERIPHIKLVTSQAGSIYIKNIINRSDVEIIVVKDGDTLSLGNKTLTFVNAPFLHWPDTMFTYLQEDKVLFSCDFLGSHYCEPQLIDRRIAYKSAYDSALKSYYDAIFGPFKSYVLKGLEKIKPLEIDFVATSHGPVLSKDGLLQEAIDKYYEWSTPTARSNKLIPIFYCSAYGNTRLIAKSIREGILAELPNAEVELYDIINHDMGALGGLINECDGFLIGSPTLNKDAVPPVWILLAHIDAVNIAKKPAAIFGSYGWSGEAVRNLRSRLTDLKANVYSDDFRVIFVPTEQDLANAVEFGKSFVKTFS